MSQTLVAEVSCAAVAPRRPSAGPARRDDA
jgi:hypothetical protein